MCDSKDEGGRRCPGCEGEARSAYRKAHGASVRAPEGGIGLGGTPAPPAGSSTPWDIETVRALADDVTAATSGAMIYNRDDGTPYTDEDIERTAAAGYGMLKADEAATRAARRLYDAHGGTEAAVVALGAQVAEEAERRAGTGVAEVAAIKERARAQAETDLEQAQAEYDAAKAAHDADPACQEMEAVKAFMFTPEGLQDRAATMARFQAADTAVRKSETYRVFNEASMRLGGAKAALVDPTQGPAAEELKQALASLSSTYTDVIAETRSVGGATPTWHPGSDPDTAQSMDLAAREVFPTDWIEAHNAGGPVVARDEADHGGRAHYLHRGASVTYTAVEDDVADIDADMVPPPSQRDMDPGISYEQAPRSRHRTREDVEKMIGTLNLEESRQRARERHLKWQARYYEVHEGDSAPASDGGPDWEDQGGGVWRRPQQVEVERTDRVSEILGRPHRPDDAPLTRGAGPGFRVAIHEMSHRMEEVVSGVKDLERAFLVRRTTREDGTREELTPLYGNSQNGQGDVELARPDSFVNAYIGKDYGKGEDATEVLSMGTESLFAGTNGGLVGAGNYQADEDMRAFVLGVYASVGRKQEQG